MANFKLKCLKQLEEFVKLVNEQLYRLDQIEELELTRDWSSPHKLSYSSLLAHKKVLTHIFVCLFDCFFSLTKVTLLQNRHWTRIWKCAAWVTSSRSTRTVEHSLPTITRLLATWEPISTRSINISNGSNNSPICSAYIWRAWASGKTWDYRNI